MFHVPSGVPRYVQMTSGVPPVASTFSRRPGDPAIEYTMERLSGDQNGAAGPIGAR